MEGVPYFNPEDKPEKDSSEEKTEKKSKKRSREVGRLITSENSENKPEKDPQKPKEIAQKAKPLLDTIIGKKTNSEETSRQKEPSSPEEEPTESFASAEERGVRELAGEGEISLRNVAEIAPERDDAVVEEAVLRSLAAETSEIEQASPVVEVETDEDEVEPPVEAPEEEPANVESENERTDEEDDPARTVSTVTAAAMATTATGSGGSGRGARPPVPPTAPLPPTPPVGMSPPLRPPFLRRPFTTNVPPQRYQQVQQSPNVNSAPASPNNQSAASPDVLNAIEDATDYAYRRGRNKGLVAGLLVGGGIEHIRHKRREKRMEKKFAAERREQKRSIENIRWDHIRETEAQKVRDEAAARFQRAERVAPATQERAVSAATMLEKRIERTEEDKKPRPLTKAELIELERQREQIEVGQGNRIEHSAWHSVEVDRHGKAVQETALDYGHEYYKERAKEVDPVSKQHVDVAAGEVALVAAALHASSPPASSSHNASWPTPSKAAESTVTSSDGATDLRDPKSVLKTITTPPTTTAGTIGWFIVLVVLLALLAIIVL
ncbi:MAG: hypothetical protein WAW63_01340 [Candidatus Saccharimonadales bacterium]